MSIDGIFDLIKQGWDLHQEHLEALNATHDPVDRSRLELVTSLHVGGVDDYSLLSCFPNLNFLCAQKDEYHDLAVFATFQKLEVLDLIDGIIDNINGLSGHPSLHSITIRHNTELDDLTPMCPVPHLRQLSLDDCCGLTSLRGLESCRALETLAIEDCFELSDISSLAGLPHLRSLIISTLDEVDTSSLSGLPRLIIKRPDYD
jgi:hypothetical protein